MMNLSFVKYFCVFLIILKVTLTNTQTLNPEKNEQASSLPSEEIVRDRKDDDPCTDSSWPVVGEGEYWTPYRDEKCLKAFLKEPKSYVQAKALCQKIDADLPSIDYLDKQKFLNDYLTSLKISSNIWLGLSYKGKGRYEWADGSNYFYENWESGSPKNRSDYCVQMSGAKESHGKWSDVICGTLNIVVCEKIQKLSLAGLHKMVMKLRKNPVPVGFIYVQLPKEKAPTNIWPLLVWKDVSVDYAGVFFRVYGGNSTTFDGSIQLGTAPRITKVIYSDAAGKRWPTSIDLNVGSMSGPVLSADEPKTGRYYYAGLSFTTSNDEVRPTNMAMRIWKRIG